MVKCGKFLIVLIIALFGVIGNFSPFTFSFSSLYAQHMQTGVASYYSKKATGNRTANGERLHHDSMTCAHRTLPFGTLLRVTSLNTGKQVVVRVNDRGPYVRNRVIDLSWGAAMKIGILGHGISKVTIEEAYSITVPLKPSPMKFELPHLQAESLELPDTLRAIWQEDELIVHKRRKIVRKKH